MNDARLAMYRQNGFILKYIVAEKKYVLIRRSDGLEIRRSDEAIQNHGGIHAHGTPQHAIYREPHREP